MLSLFFGWGRWEVVQDVPVKEKRTWRDCDPYGYETTFDYIWEGRRITYRRTNHRTGKVQYKTQEFCFQTSK